MVRILDTNAVTACGIKIEEYQVELDEVARRQTCGLDEKLSRIYDKHASLPDPKEADNASGDVVAARQAPKRRKSGRKPKHTPAQLRALKTLTLTILDDYGDPESGDPHPELRSVTALINKLRELAGQKLPKDFPEEGPARETIRDDVYRWTEEWRKQRGIGQGDASD